jgi:hypothetical protein
MKNFRGCLLTILAVVGGLILLVVLLFVGGGAYGQWRMAQVTQDLASLARELGYTPDTHLHHEVGVRDVNIISGAAYCEAKLYYTTPMHLAEFTDRLNDLKPETKAFRSEIKVFNLPNAIPSLTTQTTDPQLAVSPAEQKSATEYGWMLYSGDYKEEYISFYDTTDLNVVLEDTGLRIVDNIIKLHINAGIFPIWMRCPMTFTDIPLPPFD